MRHLRKFFWLAVAVLIVASAFYVTVRYEIPDRLADLYVAVHTWLPPLLTFERFLAIALVAGLLVTAFTLVVSVALVQRLSTRSWKSWGESVAIKREITFVKEEAARQQDQLLSVVPKLTKQLDKRVLVQTMVETASQLTSVPQANSIVSLWRLRFETGAMGFERGLYCDETTFTQTEFQPAEPPFAQVISSQRPLMFLLEDEKAGFVKAGRTAQFGAATGVMLIPLVIEEQVMGILAVCCHPDVLAAYEDRKAFYGALWGELALALAIAVQGEVAILDRLTGVYNREYFTRRLVQELERANRYQLPLSLLMVDIDNFKAVNDTLGHLQGDAVLKIIAKLIKGAVRAIDLAGRYGGEEFIVMLPDTGYGDAETKTGGAPHVAERIRQAVDEEFRGLQKPLNLTVSVGVVCRRFPEDREADHTELIRRADQELYRAKTTGKNKVCVFVPEEPQKQTVSG